MKNYCNMIACVTCLCFSATAVTSKAVVDIVSGEVDLGVNYAAGAWDLHIHDELNELEYAPDAARYVGRFPAGGPFVFPAVQNPGLPYIGIGAEELAAGTFVGDAFSLRLVAVTGPGTFELTKPDPFGVVSVMNSSDGLSAADTYAGISGGHEHFNWVFSAVGTYMLTFDASATLPGSIASSSGPVDFTFVVAVPEPTTLSAVAGGMLAITRRRRLAR